MKQAEKNKLKRAARRLAGLCEYCGHEDPTKHTTSCKHYREWSWEDEVNQQRAFWGATPRRNQVNVRGH